MDKSLSQRLSAVTGWRSLRLGKVADSEVALPWATSRNRQKVLGFAAMAVSLVLISAPFLLNVDSDVVAKAQTVAVDGLGKPVPASTEMATGEDVVVALNAARQSGNALAVTPDDELRTGAQAWAQSVAGSGSIRTDRSLRALLQDRSAVGEFVVAAPSLTIAYDRLVANSLQHGQLLSDGVRGVGVGVQASGNKTFLVIRFAS
jgi:hypothetical protein